MQFLIFFFLNLVFSTTTIQKTDMKSGEVTIMAQSSDMTTTQMEQKPQMSSDANHGTKTVVDTKGTATPSAMGVANVDGVIAKKLIEITGNCSTMAINSLYNCSIKSLILTSSDNVSIPIVYIQSMSTLQELKYTGCAMEPEKNTPIAGCTESACIYKTCLHFIPDNSAIHFSNDTHPFLAPINGTLQSVTTSVTLESLGPATMNRAFTVLAMFMAILITS